MDVLVVYATKHDSTREVAQAIAAVAAERAGQSALFPASAVRGPITGRDLVILGAPLYSGRWHRDARRFLKRHRSELATVPIAIFGMGPRTDTEDAWHRSYAQLHRALGKFPWLRPVAVTVFGGVDPPGHQHPHRDLRDWSAIRRWATETVGTARGHAAYPSATSGLLAP